MPITINTNTRAVAKAEAKKYLEQCDEILQSGFDKSESLNDEKYADLLLTKCLLCVISSILR